jgi:hypothetical protein
MLRFLEIGAVIAIVVYGIIKLIEMFGTFNRKKEKGAALDELAQQAEKVAKEKEDILNETQKNKETIDKINNTLN